MMAKGMMLGGYEIIDELGRGGMSVVYKAKQTSLQRIVAVKVLPGHLAEDAEFASRFDREATAISLLNHPHIIQIYDRGTERLRCGDEEKDISYFVMEFVDGRTLGDELKAAPLAPNRIIAITSQVCDALSYAHHQGIVHRDIKPQNILLDSNGYPKIADFGIAQLSQPDGSASQLTGTRASMGTFDYMAPEQRTDAGKVDHRADIYSFGVILYQMLTGALPQTSFALPSERNHRLSPKVDAIVVRCLKQAPQERYQNATDISRDLTAALRPAPAKKVVPRKTLVTAAAGVAAVALVAVLLLLLLKPSKSPGPETASVTDEMKAKLSLLEGPILPDVAAGSSQSVYEVLETGLDEVKSLEAKEQALAPKSAPTARPRSGAPVITDAPKSGQRTESRMLAPEVDAARKSLKRAEELLANKLNEDALAEYRTVAMDLKLPKDERCRGLLGMGKVKEAMGNPNGAVIDYVSVTSDFEGTRGLDDEIAEAFYRVGMINGQILKDFDVAKRNLLRVADEYPKTPFAPSALRDLGLLTLKQMSGGFGAAFSGSNNKALQEEAYGYFASVRDNYSSAPEAADSLYQMGLICQDGRRSEEAIQIYQEIIDRHPDAPYPVRLLQGQLYEDLGQTEKAISAYEACIAAPSEVTSREQATKRKLKIEKKLEKTTQ